MPVEIREVVLRARVVDKDTDPARNEETAFDPDQLKEEILATCERMIRDELSRGRRR
ncbi:DUF5908 family protein [uncultured Roseovarius sp.]|uniref:DUF5908 family protein n=1 Tax=uncultured Roseovarius sp. TaxID=293344 RepID=UPI00262A7A2E|nr:DUF5908 family protein [uncultured Roseovarius sp.]